MEPTSALLTSVSKMSAIEVHVSLQVPAAATALLLPRLPHPRQRRPGQRRRLPSRPGSRAVEWFVSADGHLKQEGQLHGDHDGDMPPLLLDSNGSAEATFTIDGQRRRAGQSCSDRPRWPGQLGQRPGRQRAQPVHRQQPRRSGPHPGDRKRRRPGRLRRDHRWMTRSEGQHLLVRRSPTPLDTPQRVPEGASREPPRRRLERHRSPREHDDAVRRARTRLLATLTTLSRSGMSGSQFSKAAPPVHSSAPPG